MLCGDFHSVKKHMCPEILFTIKGQNVAKKGENRVNVVGLKLLKIFVNFHNRKNYST